VGFGSVTRGLSFLAGGQSPTIRTVLRDPVVEKVFHNGAYFDIPVLRRHVFTVVNAVDTREKRFVLAPESRLSLAYLASLYTDMAPWKEQEGEGEDDSGKGHAQWETKDLNALRRYNAIDAVVTARCNLAMDKELEAHS
jgi:hypothetical protein